MFYVKIGFFGLLVILSSLFLEIVYILSIEKSCFLVREFILIEK